MSSVISSSSDDFSIVSPRQANLRIADVRSRSSTQSDDQLELDGRSVAATTTTFSDLSVWSPRAPSTIGGSQVLSVSTDRSNDDDDDNDDNEDFVLVPPSTALITPRPLGFAPEHPRSAAPFNDEDDEDEEEIVIWRSPSAGPADTMHSTQTFAQNSSADRHHAEHGGFAADDGDEEAEACARQRILREEADEGGDEDTDSEQESILFTGLMQRLSISKASPVQAMRPRVSVTPIFAAGSQSFPIVEPPSARDTPTPTYRPSTTPLAKTWSGPPPAPKVASKLPSLHRPVDLHNAEEDPSKMTPTQNRAARRKRAKLRRKARAQLQKLKRAGNNTSDDTSSSSSSSSSSSESSRPTKAFRHGSNVSVDMYEDAVRSVTAYLQDPPRDPAVDVRLHFLQSLIIELGLLHKSGVELPTSCKAAKALLKSQAHLNVREYVDCRAHLASNTPSLSSTASQRRKRTLSTHENELLGWLDELKKLMFPSKAALTRSLYARRGHKDGAKIKPVSTKWIKSRGLDVFLVSVYA